VAERLRTGYLGELASLEASLADMPVVGEAPRTDVLAVEAAKPRTRSTRRVIAGSVIVMAAVSVTIFLVVRDARPDGAGSLSGSPGDLIVDPSSVSDEQLEAVVAANPDLTAMRMALADRYYDDEEYGSSLDHYLYIADNSPDRLERSKALARVGWMAYITDQPEAAQDYILASLDADPSNAEALLFRGFITLYGLEDAETAIPQLEAALELSNLSPNVISQVNDALEDARSRVP
jgi:tetratricopeptide (TPR) repeat protein